MTHLVVVDYFSRYMEVQKLSSTTATTAGCAFPSWCPCSTCKLHGPQHASYEMKEFAESYRFTHITSSPHYPQANGQAERAVKTAKSLLEHAPDPYLALLSYRAIPLPWCKRSSAGLLMGWCLRTDLPQVKDQIGLT